MTVSATAELLAYLADLIESVERYGCVVLPPNDQDDVSWTKDREGNLVMDIAARLPSIARSRDVDLVLQEKWRPAGADAWERFAYGHELRHHELDYRRALHRHDDDWFVRQYDVVTHEHCETTMGRVECAHYFGEPVASALDAFERLYGLWLTNARPQCSALSCLEA